MQFPAHTHAELLNKLVQLHSKPRSSEREEFRKQICSDYGLNHSDIVGWFRPALDGLKKSVPGKKKEGYHNIRTLTELCALMEEDLDNPEIYKRVPAPLLAALKVEPVAPPTLKDVLERRALNLSLPITPALLEELEKLNIFA